MNQEELKSIVTKDREERDKALVNSIKEQFFSILKVEPDSVDIKDRKQTSSYFSEDFIGYKVTLDGVNFYVGKVYFLDVIYQEVEITSYNKRLFRKCSTKTVKEYYRVERLADIIV